MYGGDVGLWRAAVGCGVRVYLRLTPHGYQKKKKEENFFRPSIETGKVQNFSSKK